MTAIATEGEIAAGDYNDFIKVVKALKGRVRTVFLRSPGGSAIEAMKIGRLIRRLKMKTDVPFNGNLGCLTMKPLLDENCTCASACFLIHVAGVERTGQLMGIHRIYVGHDVLKNATASEAAAYTKEIKEGLSKYFSEMGVPPSYTERVSSIPSNKLEFLSEDEVEKHFLGFIPEYQEWAIAKCGDLDALNREEHAIYAKSKFKDHTKTIGDLKRADKEYAKIWKKIDQALDCMREIGKTMALEAYAEVFEN